LPIGTNPVAEAREGAPNEMNQLDSSARSATKVRKFLGMDGRDAYAATTEMITRYVELIFSISIISLLSRRADNATQREGSRRLSSANEFVKAT
jgi:hypothetical protein